MKRIAVDMDEVLADALSEHLTRYNRDHGEAITKGQHVKIPSETRLTFTLDNPLKI